MVYEHKQVGYLIIWITLGLVVLFGFLFYNVSYNLLFVLYLLFLLIILSSFFTLTIRVDNEQIFIKFGYGLFRKRFPIKEVASARCVKNRWYYGWGIRFWFNMWIYNVSGFDAVEIRLKNRKIYRIGTDEPIKLQRAINSFLV